MRRQVPVGALLCVCACVSVSLCVSFCEPLCGRRLRFSKWFDACARCCSVRSSSVAMQLCMAPPLDTRRAALCTCSCS